MRLSELGEFGLLRELEQRGLAHGIGDDAAIFHEGIVVTQDTLVEAVHFRLEWTSWRDLGYKAAAVNLSDLAAMGASPAGLLVALSLPLETDSGDVLELYQGLNEPGVAIVGGDTNGAETVSISVTAVGESKRVPGRAGARPGDALVVTGPLGGSAAGLYALEHGLEGFDDLIALHLRPPYRLDAAGVLAPRAHALIDLSDGIASDAARVAERSGCRLVIEVESLPLAPRIDEVADETFWARGEDYELLAALSQADAEATGFAIVGRCEEGAGIELRRGGEPLQLAGWEHFRG
ncbi:MAG: thiamine-phosphate kinase [Actinomycetota bacterium]|nr:thiamine-phosphate kinase [Actinomycetota bacterium]